MYHDLMMLFLQLFLAFFIPFIVFFVELLVLAYLGWLPVTPEFKSSISKFFAKFKRT